MRTILDRVLQRQQSWTVGVDARKLNTIYAYQKNYNWCWAACIQMIGAHHGIVLDQESLAHGTCGVDSFGYPSDCPAYDHTITSYLNSCFTDFSQEYCLSANYHRGKPDLHRLKQELENGNPVMIAYLRPGARVGHAVLITAIEYYYIGNTLYVTKFILRDPAPTAENIACSGRRVSINANQFYNLIRAHWYTSVEILPSLEPIFSSTPFNNCFSF